MPGAGGQVGRRGIADIQFMTEDRIIESDSGTGAVAIVAIIVLAILAVTAYVNYRSPAETGTVLVPQTIDVNLGAAPANR